MRNLLVGFVICVFSSTAFSGSWGVLIGPPGIGGGGTNPIGSPLDLEFNFLWDSGTELKLAVAPGILVGKRFKAQSSNLYLSAGGGLVLARDGGGLGLYTDIGYESSQGKLDGFHFMAVYTQAITHSNGYFVSSYAARIGFCYAY